MVQIAQAWLISKGCMSICGLETRETIDQALASLDAKLADVEIGWLEVLYVAKSPLPF
jgi:aryl-alcohol dehydrogenase-like predicted oxidoreductase